MVLKTNKEMRNEGKKREREIVKIGRRKLIIGVFESGRKRKKIKLKRKENIERKKEKLWENLRRKRIGYEIKSKRRITENRIKRGREKKGKEIKQDKGREESKQNKERMKKKKEEKKKSEYIKNEKRKDKKEINPWKKN